MLQIHPLDYLMSQKRFLKETSASPNVLKKFVLRIDRADVHFLKLKISVHTPPCRPLLLMQLQRVLWTLVSLTLVPPSIANWRAGSRTAVILASPKYFAPLA